MGQFGVTECNYLIALCSFLAGVAKLRDPDALSFTGRLVDLPYLSAALGLSPLPFHDWFACGWLSTNAVLIAICFYKVLAANGFSPRPFQHLLSPFLIAVAVGSLPSSFVQRDVRLISVSAGLLYSFVTNKLIVYSMARMDYASFQLDLIPLLLVAAVAAAAERNVVACSPYFLHCIVQGVAAWQLVRVLWWAKEVTAQLCERLDINCFSIKKKKL